MSCLRVVKLMEAESRTVVTGGKGKVIVYWVQSLSLGWFKVLEMDSGDSCTIMQIYVMLLN